VVDKVGSNGREQQVREQLAVVAASSGAQQVAQQLVHQFVLRLLVQACAPRTFLDREGQVAVVELDNQDGVENGRYALARVGPRAERRRPALDRVTERLVRTLP
jgi:hypothetical protein